MSKNLTRKGLALGALIGLGSTVIAGVPAFAADEVVFTPNTGTLYAAPVDDTLTLNASLVSSVPAANIAQLKYKVVTDGTFVAKVIINSAGTTTGNTHFTNGAIATNEFGTHASQAADLTGVGAAKYKPTTGTVYTPATTPTTTAVNTIAVSVDSVANATAGTGDAPGATTATKTVTVTAFIDANNNGAVDTGEFQTARTVSFLKYSEITATYTLTAPSAGATSVAGTATFTNINQAQLTKTVTGKFSINGSTNRTAVSTTASSAGVYSATDSSSISLAAGDVVGFQALIATAALGSTETTATASARTIDSIGTPALVAGDNATAAGKFRDGGEFTVRTKATKTTSGVTAGVAGVAGTATFTTGLSALSDTVYVTVNGTAYKTKAALEAASVAVTSDADGYLSVKITTTGFTTGTVVTTFAAQNYSAAVTATGEVAVYYAVDVADLANVGNGTASSEVGRLTLASSATATVDYRVLDQYGVAPKDGTFRAVLTVTGGTSTYVNVVAGKASFTVTGAATNKDYNVSLEEYVASSASYNTSYTEGSANDNGFRVVVPGSASAGTVGSISTATSITADGNIFAYAGSYTSLGASDPTTATSTSAVTNLALSDQAFSAVDTRLDKKTTAPTLAAGYDWASASTYSAGSAAGKAAVALTVTPKGSDVAATALAAPVTVSGKGMLFTIGTSVFATDEITFIAGAAGTVVNVYSHTAGANVVTIKSGSVTKTVTLTYGTIAAEASTVVFDELPAQGQAGRTVDLSATVKDKWGNTVAGASVAFNNTGVGYVQNTANVTSSSTGKVSGRLITLGADLGTSTLTATLDLATDVVVSKSIEFGVTDADVTVGGRAIYASVEFAKGKTVTVTVDGKRLYSKLFSTDAYTELKFTQKKAGKHTVTVRVSGGIAYSEVVTTTK